jgi:alpha-glucosidase (family GH31 glycosyl hydrolase)
MPTLEFFTPSISSAQADPKAIFQFPKVRFTLLTSRMIRIESSPMGQFEDRPSQVFWFRKQPLLNANIQQNKQNLSIDTDTFQLTFKDTIKGLTYDSLQVVIKKTGATIHIDDSNWGLLPGTARTLDETNGPVQLQTGLISREGWVQLDDTLSLIFNSSGWLEPRPVQTGYRDLYLLIFGQDYKGALQDYQRIAGTPSLLPRAFLGNWWSRYWEYSQEDIERLVEHFRLEQIPLSVFIIDMDWHITETGNTCSGWTGYSWNRSLFKDPPGLLNWLHNQGLITSLNLHPADGIHPHEEKYPQAALALGLNPEKNETISFDIADQRFAQVYFDQMLHPLEKEGVDFWWIDWQQGNHTSLPNLDPLWWLNHLHYYDLVRNGKKRPVIFSRWGGSGNHRYPVGFSGDTLITWKALAYQPYFTATAANAAYGWWSHDIGGHMRGMEDGELYIRWVQFGVISPIFRLHCAKDTFIDRQPWAFDAEILKLSRQAMQFRHALVPYLYTMARRNEQEGLPVITPLYYDWPDEESAYLSGGQYLLGSELMAAPVTSPVESDLNQSRQGIWFPPGEWFDFFNGERYIGSQWKIQYYGLSEIPLFARAGAILPLQAETTHNGVANPDAIDLIVFPGKCGSFKLYEDDGASLEYRREGGCCTEFSSSWTDRSISVRISPAVGDIKCIPQQRTYRVLIRGVDQPDGHSAAVNGKVLDLPIVYEKVSRTVVFGPLVMGMDQDLTVEIHTINRCILAPAYSIDTLVMRLLKRATMDTVTKWKIATMIKEQNQNVTSLAAPELILTTNQLTGLIETITGAGAIELILPQGESRVVLVNPNQFDEFKCRSKILLQVETQGTLLSENLRPVEIDYFGLILKIL